MMTLLLSATLWAVGTLIPPLAQSWGIYILGFLIFAVMFELSRVLMVTWLHIPNQAFHWWDWIVAIFFAGLIVYDVNQALRMPKTMDNAVDAAVGIYLDIINLFVRLLELYGKKKS